MKYNPEFMNTMADDLENFIETVDRFIVIEGMTKEQYKESRKKVKKLIKKLRDGDGDEVFDKERYLEYKKTGELE